MKRTKTNIYSLSLKCLFSEQKVTSNERNRDFIEVRDNTRKHADVYTTEILPKAQGIVQKISVSTDYYQHLEYEDWVECLDEQIEEARQGEADCQTMIELHEEIIKSLNKDVGKAFKSKEFLELEAKMLEEKAYWDQIAYGIKVATGAVAAGAVAVAAATGKATPNPETLTVLGTTIAAIASSVGISALESEKSGIANDAKAAIQRKNIDLVEQSIESLQHFMAGLTRLSSFFNKTSSSLGMGSEKDGFI